MGQKDSGKAEIAALLGTVFAGVAKALGFANTPEGAEEAVLKADDVVRGPADEALRDGVAGPGAEKALVAGTGLAGEESGLLGSDGLRASYTENRLAG